MSPQMEPLVERLRPRLERLRMALRHWQTCSTEYKILRRELSSLFPEATREDMLTAGTNLNGRLVDEKEVKNLLGDEIGIKRTVAQVIAELNHRIDYSQANVIKCEQQIEQGENEIDEDEEDEEDEYEDEDSKYKPTAQGLITPELQTELEEFRKRIKERGEAARAEEAKWVTEQQNKPKKRRGGVRFAEEPEEVPSEPLPPVPPSTLIQTSKDTIQVGRDPLAVGTNEILGKMWKDKAPGVDPTIDEDAQLQHSIAEEARRSSSAAASDAFTVLSPPYSAPTSPSG